LTEVYPLHSILSGDGTMLIIRSSFLRAQQMQHHNAPPLRAFDDYRPHRSSCTSTAVKIDNCQLLEPFCAMNIDAPVLGVSGSATGLDMLTGLDRQDHEPMDAVGEPNIPIRLDQTGLVGPIAATTPGGGCQYLCVLPERKINIDQIRTETSHSSALEAPSPAGVHPWRTLQRTSNYDSRISQLAIVSASRMPVAFPAC
jgi:hypothetical protein